MSQIPCSYNNSIRQESGDTAKQMAQKKGKDSLILLSRQSMKGTHIAIEHFD